MIKPLNYKREVMKLILDNSFMKLDYANEFNTNNIDNKYLKFFKIVKSHALSIQRHGQFIKLQISRKQQY